MASSVRTVLPITVHTLRSRLTNPWTGKIMQGAPTIQNTEQLVENYYPKDLQGYQRSYQRSYQQMNTPERRIPTIPNMSNQ